HCDVEAEPGDVEEPVFLDATDVDRDIGAVDCESRGRDRVARGDAERAREVVAGAGGEQGEAARRLRVEDRGRDLAPRAVTLDRLPRELALAARTIGSADVADAVRGERRRDGGERPRPPPPPCGRIEDDADAATHRVAKTSMVWIGWMDSTPFRIHCSRNGMG